MEEVKQQNKPRPLDKAQIDLKIQEMIANAKPLEIKPSKRKSFRNRSSLAQIIKTKEQGERLLKTLYALQASNGQAI